MIPKEIKYNLHYDDVRGNFDIVTVSFLDDAVPIPGHVGHILQLIRFARASRNISDFNDRSENLTVKCVEQGHRYQKLRKHFLIFIVDRLN